MRSIEFLACSIISGGLVTEQGAIRNSVFFISVKSVFYFILLCFLSVALRWCESAAGASDALSVFSLLLDAP